jgi:hypothetical protein
MNKLLEMKNCKETVKTLLEKFPNLRDNDEKLCANYWYIEANLHFVTLDANEFLRMYADGRITHSDSITRMRRKLQEKHPELRGKLWEERHKNEEPVKKFLKDEMSQV